MKKIAIYPGSFNPFTIGHLNILEKAEAIFGEGNLIIAVGVNPEKSNPIDRVATIKNNLPSKEVIGFSGFLTDLIWEKEKEGYDVTIVKGLRNGDDLDYEVNNLRFIEEMKPDVKIVFIICDKQFEHVSSSAYRALEAIREGAGYKYLAKELPSAQIVENIKCNVFIKEDETEIIKKYIIKQAKHRELNVAFTGNYIECLAWIKECVSKKT